MKEISKLTLVFNQNKAGAKELANEIAEHARKDGNVQVQLSGDFPIAPGALQGQDACGIIGGDGTLLGVVAESIASQVPVFGINRGKLGFLATYSPKDIFEDLKSLLRGAYEINPRMLLEYRTPDNNTHYALNDVVIKTASMSRLVTLRVSSNDSFVNCYDCDGLIFATPTGSTAYNLSANGPIIHPDTHAIAMTPICPHTLSNRTLIFPGNACLTAEIVSDQDACISADGILLDSSTHFPINIHASKSTLPLLQPTNYSYYSILRSKLDWGGDIPE